MGIISPFLLILGTVLRPKHSGGPVTSSATAAEPTPEGSSVWDKMTAANLLQQETKREIDQREDKADRVEESH